MKAGKMKANYVAIILMLGLPSFMSAEEIPVNFVDANLKLAVETTLGISDPTPTVT